MNVVICSFFPLISPLEHAFCLKQLNEQQFCSFGGEKVREIKFSQKCWCSTEQQRPLYFKQENVGLICAYPLHKNSSANKGKTLNCATFFSFSTQEGRDEALNYTENAYIFNALLMITVQRYFIYRLDSYALTLMYALHKRFFKIF